jgi:hypothetical protein
MPRHLAALDRARKLDGADEQEKLLDRVIPASG